MILSEEELVDRLGRLAGWRREGSELIRDYAFTDFQQAMNFINLVAEEAEAADHHPDILLHGWNKVRLMLMTHSEGGLTVKDFALAERIETLI